MTIRGLLTKAIPVKFAAKTPKSKVCEFMVNVWAVLQVVIANVSISREARHDLQQYLDLTRMPSPSSFPAGPWRGCTSQIVDQSLRYGSRLVQGVATPFLMSQNSTKIMRGRTRRLLRSGKWIIVLLRSSHRQDTIPSSTRREPSCAFVCTKK